MTPVGGAPSFLGVRPGLGRRFGGRWRALCRLRAVPQRRRRGLEVLHDVGLCQPRPPPPGSHQRDTPAPEQKKSGGRGVKILALPTSPTRWSSRKTCLPAVPPRSTGQAVSLAARSFQTINRIFPPLPWPLGAASRVVEPQVTFFLDIFLDIIFWIMWIFISFYFLGFPEDFEPRCKKKHQKTFV